MIGKVAIITGAASGVGAATARLLAQGGASVILADIAVAAGEALAKEVGGLFHKCDVTIEDDVAGAVALAVSRFGRLDIMVNNAARLGAVGPLGGISAEAWRKTMAILLDGPFYGIKHASGVMKTQGSGVILSMSSTAGLQGGLGPHAYTTAKHALIGLTKSAASELSPAGVRIMAIACSGILTPMAAALAGTSVHATLAGTSPLGSGIEPEEVAAMIAYLCGENARHMTGQTVVIDSGVTAAGRVPQPFHSIDPAFL